MFTNFYMWYKHVKLYIPECFLNFALFLLAIMALSNMGQASVQYDPSSVQKCGKFENLFEDKFFNKKIWKNLNVFR